MKHIRQATVHDLSRIAEMVIFHYRLYFHPICQNDDYSFHELQVSRWMKQHESSVGEMQIYDHSAVKGVVQLRNSEIKRPFVEPALQGRSICSGPKGHSFKSRRLDQFGKP